jgi:hypothetical protein
MINTFAYEGLHEWDRVARIIVDKHKPSGRVTLTIATDDGEYQVMAESVCDGFQQLMGLVEQLPCLNVIVAPEVVSIRSRSG